MGSNSSRPQALGVTRKEITDPLELRRIVWRIRRMRTFDGHFVALHLILSKDGTHWVIDKMKRGTRYCDELGVVHGRVCLLVGTELLFLSEELGSWVGFIAAILRQSVAPVFVSRLGNPTRHLLITQIAHYAYPSPATVCLTEAAAAVVSGRLRGAIINRARAMEYARVSSPFGGRAGLILNDLSALCCVLDTEENGGGQFFYHTEFLHTIGVAIME